MFGHNGRALLNNVSHVFILGEFMRCFENIAKLIRTSRQNHPEAYSQSELSHLLGYKNGQFISNVERALCNIPLKMLGRVSEVLNIPPQELKDAILKDHDKTLDNYLSTGSNAQVGQSSEANNASVSTLKFDRGNDLTVNTPAAQQTGTYSK